jgi:chorismate dehydratase
MQMRIAVPAYLNSRAYFHHPLPAGSVLSALYPREAIAALAEGRMQAGLVPVSGLATLGEAVECIGNYGIAARGAVKSVLLHSRVPLAELNAGHVLRLTRQSATSVRLLALLIGYRRGFRQLPAVAAGNMPVDGELLIGDAALCSRSIRTYRYTTDLAEAWHAGTGLPFVFARWVIRRDAPDQLRATLATWLASFAAGRELLHRQVAEREAVRYGLTPAAACDYLQGMQTLLDDSHLAGQALFERELARHRPEFAPALPAARLSYA